MILVDANLLLYAANRAAREHEPASQWLESQLNGNAPVGLPWDSLMAFYRITTNPRVLRRPLKAVEAWGLIREWLRFPVVWTPGPTERHAAVLEDLVNRHHVTGDLVPDAHLAAIAIQHGLEVCSADTDFARFPEVTWRNPLVE